VKPACGRTSSEHAPDELGDCGNLPLCFQAGFSPGTKGADGKMALSILLKKLTATSVVIPSDQLERARVPTVCWV